MFRGFRNLIEAILALTSALEDIVRIHREHGAAVERLDKLERERHHFEAEIEGMLLKADGKLRAANSSEARERQLKKAHEKLSDPFSPEEEPASAGPHVPTNDAPPGEAEGLPPVRVALASNNKAHAVRTKWGMQ